jgi:DNA-binding SARP family transcriptional activator
MPVAAPVPAPAAQPDGPGNEKPEPARHSTDTAQVRVRLLGPVDLTIGGTARPVAGQRRKAVLAVLALHPGKVVPTGQLINAVWGDRAPATATNTLQSHISWLRRQLGARTTILARAPGYLLNIGVEATDVEVAERLLRLEAGTVEPRRRAELLRRAVGLWRGDALMGVTGSSWAEEHADRLNRMLLRAKESLAEAHLALGQHELALDDLESLAREHPLHETLHHQLMRALYRAGKQGEALAVYQRLRLALHDELGIDPSRPLRELECAILRQDTHLDLPDPVGPGAEPTADRRD